MIVKDNFETQGLQTADGALALAGFLPNKDAFQVKRVKDAGAIVLAKSNMAEWAFSPYETVNSILPGYTRNPYALDRVTAGSSGGTAAAIAASFGLVGLGSDTGNSIRGPSSHQALAGIRSTMGLTSRAGVLPLNLLADIAGPMARTVEDAVEGLPGDRGRGSRTIRSPPPRRRIFRRTTLPSLRPQRTARRASSACCVRPTSARRPTPKSCASSWPPSRTCGAPARPSSIPPRSKDSTRSGAAGRGSLHGLQVRHQPLSRRAGRPRAGEDARRRSSSRGRFHPSVQRRLRRPRRARRTDLTRRRARPTGLPREGARGVVKTMDRLKLDAFVYPTWSNPPRLIGDLNTPHGDNSQFYSPTTGFPAINVPMGYTRGGACRRE